MTTLSVGQAAIRINQRVDQLERNWQPRRDAVTRWYKLIRLENDLAQTDMESVIGNDPRSSYNLATWLLTPKTWSINSMKAGLSAEQIQAATAAEQLVEREVSLSIRDSRGRMQGSYLAQAVRLFITTGWLCLVSAPTSPRWTINTWHPMTVFPEYAPDGTLSEVGRKYRLTKDEAMTMIFMEGWTPPTRPLPPSVTVRQWWVESPGSTLMATTMGDHLARPLGPTMFHRMPIFVRPAGGLPDDGTIMDEKWRADVGQSIVAAVLDLQKNYNKMLTYMQQLLRDTSDPKWVERSEGPGVVKPEDVRKRGVVWNIDTASDIWTIQPQGAPVDLRTHSFDLRGQIQRATFSDASFGASGEVSAFLMANITGTTKQILQPFLDVLRDGNGELLSRNLALARELGLPVGDSPLPDLDQDISLDFNYDIEIPGDFLQRANSARMLNPNFRLSQETITELQFPEVKDPFEEQLRLNTEDVARSEIMVGIKSIQELRQAAAQAHLAGDGETEALLIRAADRTEASLLGQTTPEGDSQTFRNLVEAGS